MVYFAEPVSYREPKYVCSDCGSEWDDLRGNVRVKPGQLCEAAHGFAAPYKLCKGRLRRKEK